MKECIYRKALLLHSFAFAEAWALMTEKEIAESTKTIQKTENLANAIFLT